MTGRFSALSEWSALEASLLGHYNETAEVSRRLHNPDAVGTAIARKTELCLPRPSEVRGSTGSGRAKYPSPGRRHVEKGRDANGPGQRIWLAVGAATIYYINWVYHSHARDLAENFIAIQAADSMQDVLWRLQATAMEVAERADSHTRIEVTELEEAFAGHLAEAEASSTTPEAQQLVQSHR